MSPKEQELIKELWSLWESIEETGDSTYSNEAFARLKKMVESANTAKEGETDCKCGSESSGWTTVKCCNLCGKSVGAGLESSKY